MSSGMNMEEAKKIADKMSYREAIMNCLCARCVPYRKATKIKMKRLIESIEADALDIDMDKPMHFTPEQKAWVKKYISINAERQRADAIEELLKDICIGCAYLNGTKCEIKGGCPCSIGQSEIIRSANKVLEQLKGVENDISGTDTDS